MSIIAHRHLIAIGGASTAHRRPIGYKLGDETTTRRVLKSVQFVFGVGGPLQRGERGVGGTRRDHVTSVDRSCEQLRSENNAASMIESKGEHADYCNHADNREDDDYHDKTDLSLTCKSRETNRREASTDAHPLLSGRGCGHTSSRRGESV